MSKTIRPAAVLLLAILVSLASAAHADRSYTGFIGVPFREEIRYSRESETVTSVYVEDPASMPEGMEAVYSPSGYVLQGTLSEEGTHTFTVVCVWTSGVLTIDPVTVTVLPAGDLPAQAENALPVVTKDPTDESVLEGESCKFISRATGNTDLTWYLTDGETIVRAYDAPSMFPGLSVKNTKGTTLTLSDIPADLDGWYVYARFSNDYGVIESATARISVTPAAPTPAPTVPPTPAPTAPPAWTPVPAATMPLSDLPTATPAQSGPLGHVHSYDATIWHYDESYHYHLCACGNRGDMAPHALVWETMREPTRRQEGYEKGTCAVCGFTTSRPVAYAAGSGSGYLIPVLISLVALLFVVILILIGQLRRSREEARRRYWNS